MRVPLKDIYVEPDRQRKDKGDIEDMRKDMAENGQITAITLRPPTSIEAQIVKEPFVLVAGERRFLSAGLLGWKEIEAFIRYDIVDGLKAQIVELHENLKRKEMTWDEIAKAKERILNLRQLQAAETGEEITQAEIAKELGESPATFSRDIQAAQALRADPGLKLAGSRKAALRSVEMIQHEKALFERLGKQHLESFNELKRGVREADASDYLRTVLPKSVDLILTDPPYGIDYFKQGHKMRAGGKDQNLGLSEYDDGEKAIDLMADVVPLWAKVLRETGWMLIFCGEELEEELRKLLKNCCSVHADYRTHSEKRRCMIAEQEESPNACIFYEPEPKPWIWYRPNSRNNPRYPERHAKNCYENILVVNGGKARLAQSVNNVFVEDAVYGDDRIHVMQKPVELAQRLIMATTHMGDTVLDSFFGSGALLAGAAKLGRVPLGSEKNPSMVPQAHGLIAKHYSPPIAKHREESLRRYHEGLEKPATGVSDFSEEVPND